MGLHKKKSGRQRTFIGDIQVASGVMFSGDVDHSKSVHAMAEDECDAKQVITGFFYLRMIHFCISEKRGNRLFKMFKSWTRKRGERTSCLKTSGRTSVVTSQLLPTLRVTKGVGLIVCL